MGVLQIGGQPQGSTSTKFGKGVEPNELLPKKAKKRYGPVDNSNPRTRMEAKMACASTQNVTEEVIVKDADDNLAEGADGSGCDVQEHNCGELLSNIVFSQDEFGAALNGDFCATQSQSNSIFRRLFNDILGHENVELQHLEQRREEDYDEVDMDDGIVLQEDCTCGSGGFFYINPRLWFNLGFIGDFSASVDPIPRSNPNSRSRLVRFILTTGALIADCRNCRGESINSADENIPILQCDGMYADVMNCYSVVSPHSTGVDDNVVVIP